MVINTENKNCDLNIKCAVFEQIGPTIFNNVPGHFFEHILGIECDNLSALLKSITKKYLNMLLKTYGKKFSEMVVHQHQPSRHELTNSIISQNQ